jgi:hypothetical protein
MPADGWSLAGDMAGEMGDSLPFLDLQGDAIQVTAGFLHTCAVLANRSMTVSLMWTRPCQFHPAPHLLSSSARSCGLSCLPEPDTVRSAHFTDRADVLLCLATVLGQ